MLFYFLQAQTTIPGQHAVHGSDMIMSSSMFLTWKLKGQRINMNKKMCRYQKFRASFIYKGQSLTHTRSPRHGPVPFQSSFSDERIRLSNNWLVVLTPFCFQQRSTPMATVAKQFILDWSVQSASIGRYLVVAQGSLNFYVHFCPIRSRCWWRSRQRRVSSCWRLLKQQRLRRGAWSSDWMCGTSSQTWKADWPLRGNGVPGKKKKKENNDGNKLGKEKCVKERRV